MLVAAFALTWSFGASALNCDAGSDFQDAAQNIFGVPADMANAFGDLEKETGVALLPNNLIVKGLKNYKATTDVLSNLRMACKGLTNIGSGNIYSYFWGLGIIYSTYTPWGTYVSSMLDAGQKAINNAYIIDSQLNQYKINNGLQEISVSVSLKGTGCWIGLSCPDLHGPELAKRIKQGRVIFLNDDGSASEVSSPLSPGEAWFRPNTFAHDFSEKLTVYYTNGTPFTGGKKMILEVWWLDAKGNASHKTRTVMTPEMFDMTRASAEYNFRFQLKDEKYIFVDTRKYDRNPVWF